MPDRPWKKFERAVAALIGGGRYPANMGGKLDCGPDPKHPDCRFVAQGKEVTRMSLAEVTGLVETTEEHAHGRLALVCLKIRRGKGRPSPTLVVMTSDTFTRLIGYTQGQP